METIYGIDLGTSNCLVAEVIDLFDEVNIDCLMDDEGNISFPSVVHFKEEYDSIVGEKAKNLLPDYPDSTIDLIKTKIGHEREIEVKIGEGKVTFSPQEIAALFLKHSNDLHDNKIKKAVVTIPANFGQNENDATLQVGEIGGIEVVGLVNEPTAAIMYHLFKIYEENNSLDIDDYKNYLVFDFGGGTLDLALIRFEYDEDGNLKPKGLLKGGDPDLGGHLIDLEFTKYMIEELKEEYDDAFSNEALKEFKYYYKNKRFSPNIKEKIKEFILRMRNTIEYSKIQLSKKDKVKIEFGKREYENFEIDREEFEEEILDEYFRDRIIKTLDKFKAKNKKNYRIDEVVMVGGSSQIPYFTNLIKVYFPNLKNRIVISDDYDNAVAKGAAIMGAIKSGQEVPPFGKNKFVDIIPYDLYIEYKNKEELFVPSGTPYSLPKPVEKSITIKHSLQTNIHILLKEKYEKYDQNSKEMRLIENIVKDVRFYHPFFYNNEQVAVSLCVDEKGMFHFTSKHDVTNESIDFQAEKLYQLSNKELETAKDRISKIKTL